MVHRVAGTAASGMDPQVRELLRTIIDAANALARFMGSDYIAGPNPVSYLPACPGAGTIPYLTKETRGISQCPMLNYLAASQTVDHDPGYRPSRLAFNTIVPWSPNGSWVDVTPAG